MLTGVLRMGQCGEQVADLAGGQRDEIGRADQVVVIMPRACPGKLSTAAGAPFERR
jgi:hypothetical protein